MTVSFDASWLIPISVTLFCLYKLFRPSIHQKQGDYDFSGVLEGILRVLWLVPLSLVWAVFFGIYAYFK